MAKTIVKPGYNVRPANKLDLGKKLVLKDGSYSINMKTGEHDLMSGKTVTIISLPFIKKVTHHANLDIAPHWEEMIMVMHGKTAHIVTNIFHSPEQ